MATPAHQAGRPTADRTGEATADRAGPPADDRPLADPSLFARRDPPALRGSRCTRCAAVTFPAAARCPACCVGDTTEVELPDTGTVWTWTVQSFPPKPPYRVPDSGFEPFPVGYVELGEVLVEGRFTGPVAIGDRVRLRLVDPGTGRLVHGFAAVRP